MDPELELSTRHQKVPYKPLGASVRFTCVKRTEF
jgi:hypothetical protein